MRIPLIVSRREDGAVAVMVAIFAVILIVIAAFTTDFGMAYAQRQALATGADSAALAVINAKYASEIAGPARTCDELITQDGVLATASPPTNAATIALTQINANAPFGATIAASDVTTTLKCVNSGKTLQAKVKVNRTVQPILGNVLGASPSQISREAVTALGVVNKVTGLAPIAICTNQAQAIIDKHVADLAAGVVGESAQLVPLDKVWGGGASCDGGGGSGNWGWLNFGKGVSVPDLVAYITGTYTTTLTLDSSTTPASYMMDGTPGNKGNAGPVGTAMGTIMNSVITLPVYDSVAGHGANTTYNVIGFLSVKLCGYDNKQFGACWDSSPAVKMTGNDLQVRFSSYTPTGGLEPPVCGIGEACSFDAYVTKLLQ